MVCCRGNEQATCILSSWNRFLKNQLKTIVKPRHVLNTVNEQGVSVIDNKLTLIWFLRKDYPTHQNIAQLVFYFTSRRYDDGFMIFFNLSVLFDIGGNTVDGKLP